MYAIRSYYGNSCQSSLGLGQDGFQFLMGSGALIPWLQDDNTETHIFGRTAEQAEPADAQNVINAINVFQRYCRTFHNLVGASQIV